MTRGPWLPNIRKCGDGIFAALSGLQGRTHVFGGEIMAQSVAAAMAEHPGRLLETLSTHFLRPAVPDREILYAVRALQSGTGFSRIEVSASQFEKPVCVSLVSLCADAAAKTADHPNNEVSPPPISSPAADISAFPLLQTTLKRHDLLRMKIGTVTPDGREVGLWIQLKMTAAHAAPAPGVALAFLTDRLVLTVANEAAMRINPEYRLRQLTLNHSVTMHRAFDPAQPLWMRISIEETGADRVFCRGDLWNMEGDRVGSYAQAGLLIPVS